MLHHLGYVAIALALESTTNHTCRLRNARPERLRGLMAANLEGLGSVLRYNLSQSIYLYRVSSQIVPFASHPVNQIAWWDEFAGQMYALGEFIRRHGFRVSMHPGRFTVLNSPDPRIVADARNELAWHVRFLDCLGVGPSSKIVLHGGGAYGSKGEARARLVSAINELPSEWLRRLVIENDERTYTVQDMLAVSEQTSLPVIVDWLHYQANPGHSSPATDATEMLARAFATWHPEDGPPKVHYSEQAPGGRSGSHADWVDPQRFLRFLEVTPPLKFDCMLEAKKKDLALLRLRSALRIRGILEADAV